MKKLFIAALAIVAVSSCAFINDLNKNCRIQGGGATYPSGFSGPVTVCLECDSPATVVKKHIAAGMANKK